MYKNPLLISIFQDIPMISISCKVHSSLCLGRVLHGFAGAEKSLSSHTTFLLFLFLQVQPSSLSKNQKKHTSSSNWQVCLFSCLCDSYIVNTPGGIIQQQIYSDRMVAYGREVMILGRGLDIPLVSLGRLGLTQFTQFLGRYIHYIASFA